MTREYPTQRRAPALAAAATTASLEMARLSSNRNAPSREAMVRHAPLTVPEGRSAASVAMQTNRLVRLSSPSFAPPNASSAHVLAHLMRAQQRVLLGNSRHKCDQSSAGGRSSSSSPAGK